MHGLARPMATDYLPMLVTNTDASLSEVAYNSRRHNAEPSSRVRCKPSPANPPLGEGFFSLLFSHWVVLNQHHAKKYDLFVAPGVHDAGLRRRATQTAAGAHC